MLSNLNRTHRVPGLYKRDLCHDPCCLTLTVPPLSQVCIIRPPVNFVLGLRSDPQSGGSPTKRYNSVTPAKHNNYSPFRVSEKYSFVRISEKKSPARVSENYSLFRPNILFVCCPGDGQNCGQLFGLILSFFVTK